MKTANYDLESNQSITEMAVNYFKQVGPIPSNQENQCHVAMFAPDKATPIPANERWKILPYHKYHTNPVELVKQQFQIDGMQIGKKYPTSCHFTPALFDYSLFPKYTKGKKIGQIKANHSEDCISGSSTFLADMDGREKVGDAYEIIRTPQECVNQFQAFIRASEASKHNIKYVLVNSGYGIHIYFPFDTIIPLETWKPIQVALIELMKAQPELDPDEGVKDMGRVLRMPGTFNRKVPSDPRMVHTLIELDNVDDTYQRNDLENIIAWIKHNNIEISPQRTSSNITLPSVTELEAGTVNHDSFDKLMEAYPDYRFAMDGLRGGGALIGTKLSTVIDATKAILSNPKYPQQFNALYGQLMRAYHWQACKHEQDRDVCYQLAYIAMSHHPQFGASDDKLTGEEWVAQKWKYCKVDRGNPVTWGTFWFMAGESGYQHSFDTDKLPSGERQCFTSDHSKVGEYQDDPFFYINAWCVPNEIGQVAMDDLIESMKKFGYEPERNMVSRAIERFAKLHQVEITKDRKRVNGIRKTFFRGMDWQSHNKGTTFKMTPEQRDAVDRAVLHLTKDHSKSKPTDLVFRLFAMAGAGKTELIKYITEETISAVGRDVEIMVMTPTNKAATILVGKGNKGADTIHSKARQPVNEQGEPYRDVHDPTKDASKAYGFIIDECSMINNEIGTDIAKFKKPIIAIGDSFQLEAIQDGKEDDFCDEETPSYYMSKHRFKNAPEVQLQKIHRQGGMSRVLINAWQLRNGRTFTDTDSTDDFGIVNARNLDDQIYTSTLKHFSKYGNMIICGMNKTRHAMNRKVRIAMGIDPDIDVDPIVGERLIVMQSAKKAGWLNGQIYEVMAIDQEESNEYVIALKVRLAGTERKPRLAKVPRVYFRDSHLQQTEYSNKPGNAELIRDGRKVWMNFAYSISCHRAQGSQWKDVLVIDEASVFGRQHRKWMYTAITRAENAVMVLYNIGELEANAIKGKWTAPQYDIEDATIQPNEASVALYEQVSGQKYVPATSTPAFQREPAHITDNVINLNQWKKKKQSKESPADTKEIARQKAMQLDDMIKQVQSSVA